jgi:hypothetical protein
VTARDNQTNIDQPHDPRHLRGNSPTDTGNGSTSQPPLDYIRHIIDTAPRPSPAQLARLAGLLRSTPSPDTPN